MNTVPDKCPFCESQIMVHGGNLLRSADGGFASYECKTVQDIELSDDEWKRAGQSDACRKREVQLLTKQRDEARERIKRLEEFVEQLTNPKFTRDDLPKEALLQSIKRLEEAGDAMATWLSDPRNLGDDPFMSSQWQKAKEAKP